MGVYSLNKVSIANFYVSIKSTHKIHTHLNREKMYKLTSFKIITVVWSRKIRDILDFGKNPF